MSLGRALNLFRAYIPNWRFFEDVGPMPVLLCRVGDGPWQPCLPQPKRTLTQLVFNPGGNYLLACGNLLQHLTADLETADESKPDLFEATVSYQLVKRLVRHELERQGRLKPKDRYQFKICALVQGASDDQMEDVLLSPIYEANHDAAL